MWVGEAGKVLGGGESIRKYKALGVEANVVELWRLYHVEWGTWVMRSTGRREPGMKYPWSMRRSPIDETGREM